MGTLWMCSATILRLWGSNNNQQPSHIQSQLNHVNVVFTLFLSNLLNHKCSADVWMLIMPMHTSKETVPQIYFHWAKYLPLKHISDCRLNICALVWIETCRRKYVSVFSNTLNHVSNIYHLSLWTPNVFLKNDEKCFFYIAEITLPFKTPESNCI